MSAIVTTMQPWRSLDSSPYIAFRRSVNSNKPIQLNAHPTFYVSHVTIRGSVLYNKSLCRIRMISYKTTTVLFDQLVHWCRKRNESISFVHDTIEFIALLLSNEATYKHGHSLLQQMCYKYTNCLLLIL